MTEKEQQWALFWCGILHPIIYEEVTKGEVYPKLVEISLREHLRPDGVRKRISLSTLKRKLWKYKKAGFENLVRKKRADFGKSRAHEEEILKKAVELKKDQPERSAIIINTFLKDYHYKVIPESTMYRHLKKEGATKSKLGIIKEKVRCRWTREKCNDLWIGDFSEGPYVITENASIVPTYYSLFIDCASRYVVKGRYFYRQSLDILIDTLLRAFSEQGIPQEIYVDNAKVYHANAFKAACYSLKIKLLHRKKGDPSPGGLVERFFGTAKSQFQTEVRLGDILTLDKLNLAFSAYLETVYHKTIHSEINQEPLKVFREKENVRRNVDMSHVIQFFLQEAKRCVHRDFSDISLLGKFYKVDPKFRGDKVLVRFDPFSAMKQLFLYSMENQYLGIAELYDRQDKREVNTPKPVREKPKHNLIELMIKNHEKQFAEQTKSIDFVKIMKQKSFSFLAFIQEIALILGLKGSISSFNSADLELLKKFYDRHSKLNKPFLYQAAKKAEKMTLSHLLFALQQFYKEL